MKRSIELLQTGEANC